MTKITFMEWWLLAGYASVILGILFFGELIHLKSIDSSDNTRKIVHILVGVVSSLVPMIFEHKEALILISLVFIIVNLLILIFKILPSLQTSRFSLGTVFFPLSFLILILLFWDINKIFISYGMIIMALADGLASVTGTNVKKPHIYNPFGGTKSIEGSLAAFVTTVLLTWFVIFEVGMESFHLSGFNLLILGINLGLMAIVLENLSIAGTDNLSLPLGSATVLYGLLYGYINSVVLLIVMVFTGTIGVLSYYRKWLEAGGVLLMILFAVLISGPGKPAFLIPILMFFLSGSLLSKLGRQEKTDSYSGRSIAQVGANGAVPVLLIFLYHFMGQPSLIIAYFAAVAVATADTWATEIGKFSKKNPVRITRLTPCDPGLSGGVTVYGLIASVLGSALIASLLFLPYFNENSSDFFIVLLAGFIGSVLDSVIGDLWQIKYHCPQCGKVLDTSVHCSVEARPYSGRKWITNNGVNFMTITLVGFGVWFLFLI